MSHIVLAYWVSVCGSCWGALFRAWSLGLGDACCHSRAYKVWDPGLVVGLGPLRVWVFGPCVWAMVIWSLGSRLQVYSGSSVFAPLAGSGMMELDQGSTGMAFDVTSRIMLGSS